MNGLTLVSGSFAAAEDAVQEALARAWELTESGGHIESPRAWVTRVAGNLLKDRFRRFRAERRARDRLADHVPNQVDQGVERSTDLAQALASLPRRQREVTMLRYYLEFEVEEIALVLRIPSGTVKSALYRARRSLAKALSENDDEAVEARDVTD